MRKYSEIDSKSWWTEETYVVAMVESRFMLSTVCVLSVEVVGTTVTLPNHQTKAATSAFALAVLPDDSVRWCTWWQSLGFPRVCKGQVLETFTHIIRLGAGTSFLL